MTRYTSIAAAATGGGPGRGPDRAGGVLADEPRTAIRRAGRLVVLGFWTLQFIELTVAAFLTDGRAGWRSLTPRILVLAVGITLSLGFVEAVRRLEERREGTRLATTFALALAVCVVMSAINYAAFRAMAWDTTMRGNPIDYVYTALSWSWFFLTVASATIALSYGFEVRDREARLAAMEATATEARLVALRYQLNPHFLFNALNSVAALVADDRPRAAEETVENLSDLLRASLEIEPRDLITLEREIELQKLYLSVEEVRFSDRLTTRIDLPHALRDALVPALILQPLVENAIRHSVSRTVRPVQIRITATTDAGRLVLEVEDDGRADAEAGAHAGGTGVGTANVRARLIALFGDDQSFESGPLAGNGWRSLISLPHKTRNEPPCAS